MSRFLVIAGSLLVGLVSTAARADSQVITLAPSQNMAGIAVNIPDGAEVFEVSATSTTPLNQGEILPITLAIKANQNFDVNQPLINQAAFYAYGNTGTASVGIGDYSIPALHSGTWYVGLYNRGTTTVTIELSTEVSMQEVPTEFSIHFDAPDQALIDGWGGAANLDCSVAEWNDPTVTASGKTLGEVRRELLQNAADKLGLELSSPVPVRIQACWKEFDDDDPDDSSYTLAAATGTYFFYNDPKLPKWETWYAMAPSARMIGTPACNSALPGSGNFVDCGIPDILVWFNSAEVAAHNYDEPSDAPLVTSVTMHEVTHGLGFLSQVDTTDTYDDDDDESTPDVDNPSFGKLWDDRNDAYTDYVGFIWEDPQTGDPDFGDPDPGFAVDQVVPYMDLPLHARQRSLTSQPHLIWLDQPTAAQTDNRWRNNSFPYNLVRMHAPSEINPGSTLSHVGPSHLDQLMTAFIQNSHPDTLGLARPILYKVGWNPEAFGTQIATPPPTGSWYDPDHSGHGIDLQRAVADPVNGDVYTVIFYTYDDQGDSEYYLAAANLQNGHFASANAPADLARPLFDPTQGHTVADPNSNGSVSIDFSPAAASDPACAGNAAPVKAVMRWSIDGDSDAWCIVPITDVQNAPPASSNVTGQWYAGQSDSGWGLTVGEQVVNSNILMAPILLYYYDSNNQPRWAQAEIGDYQPGMAATIYAIDGYCRTCNPQSTSHHAIGNITIGLDHPDASRPPSGDNRLGVDIDSGALQFFRDNAPVTMISVPGS